MFSSHQQTVSVSSAASNAFSAAAVGAKVAISGKLNTDKLKELKLKIPTMRKSGSKEDMLTDENEDDSRSKGSKKSGERSRNRTVSANVEGIEKLLPDEVFILFRLVLIVFRLDFLLNYNYKRLSVIFIPSCAP